MSTRELTLGCHRARWRDYLELCKPKVVAVMLLTASVGVLLAQPGLPPLDTVLLANAGIGLAAAAAAVINHVVDQKLDQQMARTYHRPVAQGRISTAQALIFAAITGILGLAILWLGLNPLVCVLTAMALLGYAVFYTLFLKRATPQNIVIGGLAGAAPPMLGWVAVTGALEANSLLLMLIIFAWTPPHFWPLAIARKSDYERAGIPMLPVTHGERYTCLQIILYTLLMLITTLLPFLAGMSSWIYLAGISVLNIRFLYLVCSLYQSPDTRLAMQVFWYSIRYIMYLFGLLLLDHYLLP